MGTYQEDLLYNELSRLKEVNSQLRQRIKELEQDKKDLQADLAGELGYHRKGRPATGEPTRLTVNEWLEGNINFSDWIEDKYPSQDTSGLREENERLRDQLKQWDRWYESARHKLESYEQLRVEVEGVRMLKRSKGEGSEERWQAAYKKEYDHRKHLEQENESLKASLRTKDETFENERQQLESKNRTLEQKIEELRSINAEQGIKNATSRPEFFEQTSGENRSARAVADDIPPSSPVPPRKTLTNKPPKETTRLSHTTGNLQQREPAHESPARMDPSTSRSHPTLAPQPRSISYGSKEERQLAQAFADWCQQGGTLVSRVTNFGTALKSILPGANVVTMSRDMDSPARPIELKTDNVVSPAEYWVVSLGMQHWLLPQPQGSTHFRELSPCFESQRTNINPSSLQQIKPGRLQSTGAGMQLVEVGVVA